MIRIGVRVIKFSVEVIRIVDSKLSEIFCVFMYIFENFYFLVFANRAILLNLDYENLNFGSGVYFEISKIAF